MSQSAAPTGSRVCAIVGTGSIGVRHLRLLDRQPGVTALAFPIRSERRRELQEEGFQVLKSWEEARERGVTHAVIATNTGRHAADALRALTAGCHVLVEKPMATNASAAVAMAAAAERHGKVMWVACCLRFQAALQRFRDRLPEIGRVRAVRIECQSYLPDWRPNRSYRDSYSARADEGGVLRDLIHEIDYAGWLFGWPRAVDARVENLGRLGIDAEEAADLMWQTDAGTVVSIRLDHLTRPARRRMSATGARGTMEWDGICGTVTVKGSDGACHEETMKEDPDAPYVAQAAAFLSASPASHDPRLATAADGVRALSVCDAARVRSLERRAQWAGQA